MECFRPIPNLLEVSQVEMNTQKTQWLLQTSAHFLQEPFKGNNLSNTQNTAEYSQ